LDAGTETEALDATAVALHLARVQANREAAARQSEATLRRAVGELPQYALRQDGFDRVLQATPETRRSPARGWYAAAGIAASLALLVTLGWFTGADRASERVQVTYSEETLYAPDHAGAADSLRTEAGVLAFVRAHCSPAVLPCQHPEFKGLLAQYQELEAARQELAAQIRAHREQPQLVRYLVRVEKEQTEVGKRLIQYLRI
jgi:hypothetical protein